MTEPVPTDAQPSTSPGDTAERFFLCSGIPRSGTTFLQRMLDMHPAVSCPSEQSFAAIQRNVAAFAGHYNQVLRGLDERTGGQGAPEIGTEAAQALLRETILTLSRGFAGTRRVHGLNDNGVVLRPAFYDALFGGPPLICIFRDPVDRALSLWSHTHWLAAREPRRAAEHLKLLDNPEGTVAGFVARQAAAFPGIAADYGAFAEGRANILTVGYERLVADKAAELGRIFGFLGVAADPHTIDAIAARSTPQAMAAESRVPEVFNTGGGDAVERPQIDAALRARLLEGCADSLERIARLAGAEPVHRPSLHRPSRNRMP